MSLRKGSNNLKKAKKILLGVSKCYIAKAFSAKKKYRDIRLNLSMVSNNKKKRKGII